MRVEYNDTVEVERQTTVKEQVQIAEREIDRIMITLHDDNVRVTVRYTHYDADGNVVQQGHRAFTPEELAAAGYPVKDRLAEFEALTKAIK